MRDYSSVEYTYTFLSTDLVKLLSVLLSACFSSTIREVVTSTEVQHQHGTVLASIEVQYQHAVYIYPQPSVFLLLWGEDWEQDHNLK